MVYSFGEVYLQFTCLPCGVLKSALQLAVWPQGYMVMNTHGPWNTKASASRIAIPNNAFKKVLSASVASPCAGYGG